MEAVDIYIRIYSMNQPGETRMLDKHGLHFLYTFARKNEKQHAPSHIEREKQGRLL
jgi:hypothetical protein